MTTKTISTPRTLDAFMLLPEKERQNLAVRKLDPIARQLVTAGTIDEIRQHPQHSERQLRHDTRAMTHRIFQRVRGLTVRDNVTVEDAMRAEHVKILDLEALYWALIAQGSLKATLQQRRADIDTELARLSDVPAIQS